MDARRLVSVLFVFYCFEVGIFLVLAPWSQSWERLLLSLPLVSGWLPLLTHPATRGLITGFGLVHLVWGVHDIDFFLRQRNRREHDS